TIVIHGIDPIHLGLLAWPVTMLWIVGMTVAINFSDGLHGLAAGVSAIACAVIASVAIWSGQTPVALLALALLGSLSGFLLFNFNPLQAVTGDCGSMFIGFMLASLCVLSAPAAGTTAGLALPAIALSIPIVDAILTLIRRAIVNRRSLFSADRGHVHHRLTDMGLCEKHAVLILYGCSMVATAIGLLALLDNGAARVGGFLLLIPLLLLFFRTAGSTQLRVTVAAVRRNRAIGRESRRYQRVFEDMQLRFRSAETFGAWWLVVCAAGEQLDFASIKLPVSSRDKTEEALSWHRADALLSEFDRVSAVLPIRDRRTSSVLRVHVAVPAHTSLESAGHRLALFSRLMGEHHPASLPHSSQRHAKPVASDHPAGVGNGHGEDNGNGNGAKHGIPALGISHAQNYRRSGSELGLRPSKSTSKIGLTDRDVASMMGMVKSRAGPRALAERPIPASRTALHLLAGNDHLATHERPAGLPAHLRVAIVHDFLYCYAGAEKVLEQIIVLFPGADLFSLVDFLPSAGRGFILDKPVTASFIQKMPLARRRHRAYLPLMPFAVEQLDVSSYDLVISSSYLAAKGVMTGPDQLHICYCHTPPRFAWDLQHQYLSESGLVRGIRSLLARVVLHYIRNWDAHSANAVDVFVTNSDFVGRRIEKVYRRTATTIYPPVAVNSFAAAGAEFPDREDFYLTASRMVPYKRIDLIIETFNAMPDRRLLVVGEGPMLEKMRAKAGPNVRIVGHQSFENLKRYMHLARAFIFAAEEDFGIVPVEAQACGTPVIAFGRGGVTESVIAGKTGVFFSQQSANSLTSAVQQFESIENAGGWDADRIRRNAQRFSIERFRDEFMRFVVSEWERFCIARRQGQG
ncbi:MAG TPA: glycosyltransferase, partial [Humisphaera sp.]|nr:glycosyltransferase [Humisphaera sp.]